MVTNVVVGCLLVVLTTLVHTTAMIVSLHWLEVSVPRETAPPMRIHRAIVVAVFVLIMFGACIVEAAIWAGTFEMIGALTTIESALYFSMVNYTTLGYGDIVLDQRWRLLASFEAANGILMFGWTTALVFAAVQRVYMAQIVRRPR